MLPEVSPSQPDLRYPIGRFHYTTPATPEQRMAWLRVIESTPARVRAAVEGWSNEQLDTAYRPGGWTARQVIHHIADSHLNSYTRFRLALTEQEPTIKPYDEGKWAELADARTADVEMSIVLLEALHRRWMILLRSLQEADWARTFKHPERGAMTLEQTLGLYAWHGSHHIAHIAGLRDRMGW